MKKNQIINNIHSYNILSELIKEYCFTENNFYIIDENTYKKLVYNNKIQDFLERLKPYYYESKIKYLDNCKTYSNFLTIIRQICTYNNITYVKKILYKKSKYTPYYQINMSSIDIL